MTTGTSDSIMRAFVQRMLHPDKIPPEAVGGGINPELAWQRWCENRAAGRDGKEPPHQKLSSAERWWFGRFDRGWQQECHRACSAIDDRGTRGTLVGTDDPHGGYGHKDEDSQYPVGPVDPPGPEAYNAAGSVASPDAKLERFFTEDRLAAGRRGLRAAGQLQGRPGRLGRASFLSRWCGG